MTENIRVKLKLQMKPHFFVYTQLVRRTQVDISVRIQLPRGLLHVRWSALHDIWRQSLHAARCLRIHPGHEPRFQHYGYEHFVRHDQRHVRKISKSRSRSHDHESRQGCGPSRQRRTLRSDCRECLYWGPDDLDRSLSRCFLWYRVGDNLERRYGKTRISYIKITLQWPKLKKCRVWPM